VSTRKNLTTHVRTFLIFTTYFCLNGFPVQEDILIVYIQFLGQNLKSPASIKNYILGLQTVSNLHGLEFPDISCPLFKYHFKGLARTLAHTTVRASPITPVILESILQKLDLSNPLDASMWAVMLTGFLLFARIGNLLPKTVSGCDLSKQLTRSDVFMAQDAVIFILKWTKTIQNMERVLQVPLYIDQSSKLCPKKALVNMVSVSPGSSSDHLYCYRTSSGNSLITQHHFTQFLRSKLSQCGICPDSFSGHSLRRGGATCAFAKGVSSELIKSHGDWQSDCYMVYLDFSLKDRLHTTKSILAA